MAEIMIRLKEDSVRKFLTTQNGVSIFKKEWTIVDDKDSEINKILLFRKDIEFKDVVIEQTKRNKELEEKILEEKIVEFDEEMKEEEHVDMIAQEEVEPIEKEVKYILEEEIEEKPKKKRKQKK